MCYSGYTVTVNCMSVYCDWFAHEQNQECGFCAVDMVDSTQYTLSQHSLAHVVQSNTAENSTQQTVDSMLGHVLVVELLIRRSLFRVQLRLRLFNVIYTHQLQMIEILLKMS